MYDPTVGRFISKDPIGFEGGDANTSRDVGNSPTNVVDPSGCGPLDDYGHFFYKDYIAPPVEAIQAINDATLKPIARAFWEYVITTELKFKRHYYAAAYLLEYSLQNNPSDLNLPKNNFISREIAASSEYQAAKKQI